MPLPLMSSSKPTTKNGWLMEPLEKHVKSHKKIEKTQTWPKKKKLLDWMLFCCVLYSFVGKKLNDDIILASAGGWGLKKTYSIFSRLVLAHPSHPEMISKIIGPASHH